MISIYTKGNSSSFLPYLRKLVLNSPSNLAMPGYIKCITEKGNSRLSQCNTFSDKILSQYTTFSALVMSTSIWGKTEGKNLVSKKVKSCNNCLRSISNGFRRFSSPGYTNLHYALTSVTLKSHEGGCASPQSSRTEASSSKTNGGALKYKLVVFIYLLKHFIYIYTHLPTVVILMESMQGCG